MKLAYLTDIFDHLNRVISSMQGRSEHILTSSNIIAAFKDKTKLCKIEVNEGNIDMFPRTAETKNKRHKGADL
jgi:hypothetical protein